MAVLHSYTFDSGTSAVLPATDWAVTNVGSGSNFDMAFNTTRAVSATASGSTIARNLNSITAAGGADVVHSVYKNSIASNSQAFIFGIQHSGSFTHTAHASSPLIKPGSGLAIQITPTGGVYAFVQQGTTTTYLNVTNAFPAMTAQVFWKFRLVHTNGRLKVRMWLASDAEPSTWNVDEAIPAGVTIPDGNFWMGAKNVSGNAASQYAYTDDLTISDAGAPANVDVTVSAGPATASALAVDPVVSATVGANASATKSVTKDAAVNEPIAGQMNLTSTGGYVYFGLDLSGLPTNPANIASAKFRFDADASATFDIKSVDVAWSDNSRPNSPGATTFGSGSMVNTKSNAAYNEIDLLTAVREWVSGTRVNNGFALVGKTGSGYIGGRDGATGFMQPVLEVTYYVAPVGSTVTPTPATASAVMVDPALSAGTGATHVAAPATASAAMPEPAVTGGFSYGWSATPATATALAVDPTVSASTNPDVTLLAPAMTAQAEMRDGTFSSPVSITADSAVADAAFVEPTFTADKNAGYKAQPMTARAVLVPVAEEQGETADPYYSRIFNQTDTNDIWLRLDETSGTEAKDRMTGLTAGTYMGSPVLGVFGLENRRGVLFDGVDDYIQLVDNDVASRNGTFEIVFKTEDSDGTLMYGNDNAVFNPAMGGTFVSNSNFITRVGLEGGRVVVAFANGNVFRGSKVVADNNWHHLTVTWSGNRLHVFLDGAVHFQRYLLEGQNIVAVPDTIGENFAGEVMEFVFHKENVLDNTDAVRNYYAAFGITPVQAGPMTATASMPDAKGKGNRKRALALFYSTENDVNLEVPNYHDRYNWTGLRTSATKTGMTRVVQYGPQTPFNMGEFIVFPKSIQRDEMLPTTAYLGGSYFDEITGEPRYLDISKDMDTSDYDLVFFINLPNQRQAPVLYEDMIAGVRKAQDEDGFSIWAPQPEVAIALGVIDRVEAHGFMRESKVHDRQGNAAGLYDWRGADIDPFSGPGLTLAPRAYHYWDTHALNKYRVVANVEGFTDLKGYRLKDYFFGRPRDNFQVPFEAWKHEELTNGLTIGMTEYYQQDFFNLNVTTGWLPAHNKRRSVVAVPPGNVKAGTVVLREVATHWVEDKEVANPYSDYATAIVVEPGQSLKGRPVNGKIFVSFMAGLDDNMPQMKKQLIPPNEELSSDVQETPEQREWDYSSSRVAKMAISTAGETSAYGGGTQTPQSEAALAAAFRELMLSIFEGNGEKIFGVVEDEKYPTVTRRRYTVIERALNWLGNRVPQGPGDKTIRVAPATATATAVAPVVSAEKDVIIPAQAALATATLVRPASVDDPNVAINVLPMTARADITGYGKTITAEPMTAYAELVENFDMVHAGGEQIVLVLHHVEPTLYLLEDA